MGPLSRGYGIWNVIVIMLSCGLHNTVVIIMQNERKGDEGLETWIQKWKDETVMLENKIAVQKQQIQQLESKGLLEKSKGTHF